MTRRFAIAPLLPLLILPWLLTGRVVSSDGKDDAPPRLRRPVALSLLDAGRTLVVANRDSGDVATLDTASFALKSHARIGRRLSDMTSFDRQLLVTDETAGELILLGHAKETLTEMLRLRIGMTPVSVRISADGKRASVALLWPRRLVIVDLQDPRRLKIATTVDLPFAPRRQLVAGAKLIVADAFGADIAVIDPVKGKLERVFSLASVHNIRGLALDRSGKNLLVAAQRLHATGHPTAGEIRSGNVISNELHKLTLADVLDPLIDPQRDDHFHPLGDIERGAGDPADVLETADGKTLVAFGGVDELAIGEPDKATWARLDVGRRPTALAVDESRRRAYVANTLGDSISVIDLTTAKLMTEIRLAKAPVDLRPEERGEMLFHDARLSLDGWYSCQSCHTDGHTNGRLNDNLTDGSYGTPKRVLSLLGVKDTGPYAWNGKMPTLEAQVRQSLKSTMQGGEPKAEIVRDIIAYLETLQPPPALVKAREQAMDAATVERGHKVFEARKCGACHTPPLYTTTRTFDVGLRDEAGLTHFNPPSLRGLSQARPYFHDGRARTLEDVFRRHGHPGGTMLADEELSDLLAFLGSL